MLGIQTLFKWLAMFICMILQLFLQKIGKRKSEEKKFIEPLKYLIIGTPGVGKTKIFEKFNSSNRQSNTKQEFFRECSLRNDINLVDTPSIDFEGSADTRDLLIQQFSQYMMNNHINHFFLVVNFERTDLMKKKLLNVLKYFKKYQEEITILVSNFQISENQENDKKMLREQLNLYLNSRKSLLFVEKNFDVENLRNQLFQEARAFSLKDTIFEPINETEQQQQEFIKQLNSSIDSSLQTQQQPTLLEQKQQQNQDQIFKNNKDNITNEFNTKNQSDIISDQSYSQTTQEKLIPNFLQDQASHQKNVNELSNMNQG